MNNKEDYILTNGDSEGEQSGNNHHNGQHSVFPALRVGCQKCVRLRIVHMNVEEVVQQYANLNKIGIY